MTPPPPPSPTPQDSSHTPGDHTLGESQLREDSAPGFPSRTTADPKITRQFAIDSARLCRDDKCTHVLLLDVRVLSQVTDYIIIASGTSERQMRSVLDHIDDMGKDAGFPAFRISTDSQAEWLLADFVDVVVHLFEPEARRHFDLETLWGDAPKVEWDDRTPEQQSPDEPDTE